MTLSTPLSGVNHPLKGILLIVVATFLFSSHDALSKYLAGFYPIVMVVCGPSGRSKVMPSSDAWPLKVPESSSSRPYFMVST